MTGVTSNSAEDWLAQAWRSPNPLIPQTLDRPGFPPGLRLLTPTVTDSTNRLVWELYHQGHSPPLGAIAQEQTAGRGQWGRSWQSAPGGLYLSLLMAAPLPPDDPFALTMASGWGLAEALNRHGVPVKLKWPNDLLLQGKKLGGIKLEIHPLADNVTAVVMGVGLNWSNPIPPTGIPLQPFCYQAGLTTLNHLGDLAEMAIGALTLGWQKYLKEGIEAIHIAYLAHFAHRGQPLTLPQGPAIIQSVTPQGQLVVTLASADPISSPANTQLLDPGTLRLGYAEHH